MFNQEMAPVAQYDDVECKLELPLVCAIHKLTAPTA